MLIKTFKTTETRILPGFLLAFIGFY